MPSAIDIPQRFTTDDPAQLKRELERMAQALDLFTRQALSQAGQLPIVDMGTDSLRLVYGRGVRIQSVLDGVAVEFTLPTPARQDIGKRCAVLRSSTTGIVTVVGVGALVGGFETYTMASDTHLVEFLLGNDLNFYPTRAGAAAE